MANGRKKKHHAHELGDPYSEGWDARAAWNDKLDKPVNPYPPLLPKEDPLKPFAWLAEQKRIETRAMETAQWDLGWADWEVDFEKDDLDDVTAHDFRRLGVKPRVYTVEDDD